MKKVLNVGDRFFLPHCAEYEGDVFIVTGKRTWGDDSYMLDGMCEGEENIQISINIDDVEAF